MGVFARTLEAFADTIVPPDDAPGGAGVGALALYRDPFYKAAPALPAVALHLNATALFWRGRTFPALPLPDRTAVVARCERSPLLGQAYEGLVMLTKLAFYGAITSPAGHAYIEFGGPNEGYPDPDGNPTFEGDTPDGNYP